MVIFAGNMIMGKYNNKSPVSRHLAFAASGVALLGLFATTADSQTNDSVIVDVSACIDIEDREAQLECYESRVNEMLRVREFERDARQGEPAVAGAEPAEAEVAATARPQQAEEPELSRAERRAQRRAERQQLQAAEAAAEAAEAAAIAAEAAARAADTPSSTSATVTAVREIEPNMLLVTLDNGQIWRQNRARRYPIRVGSTVVLRPSQWGPSFRLSDPSIGGFIQVERRR